MNKDSFNIIINQATKIIQDLEKIGASDIEFNPRKENFIQTITFNLQMDIKWSYGIDIYMVGNDIKYQIEDEYGDYSNCEYANIEDVDEANAYINNEEIYNYNELINKIKYLNSLEYNDINDFL